MLVAFDDGASTTLERWGERGPAMLCIHGMTSSRKSWERFALHYAGRFRVYAYDQRGHGDSAQIAGPMTLHRSLLDLCTVLDAVDEPVETLVGHSWGGAAAILGGKRCDVARVVAIDPMLRQAGDDWYRELLEEIAVFFEVTGEARDARIRAAYADWSQIDRERKVHALQAMTGAPIERLRDENPPETWDLRSDLVAYAKPLLLALADPAESLVEAGDRVEICERGGPLVEVETFHGQGHNLHRTDFDRFIARLDAFLVNAPPPVPR